MKKGRKRGKGKREHDWILMPCLSEVRRARTEGNIIQEAYERINQERNGGRKGKGNYRFCANLGITSNRSRHQDE